MTAEMQAQTDSYKEELGQKPSHPETVRRLASLYRASTADADLSDSIVASSLVDFYRGQAEAQGAIQDVQATLDSMMRLAVLNYAQNQHIIELLEVIAGRRAASAVPHVEHPRTGGK